MAGLSKQQIEEFLHVVGQRLEHAHSLFLLGGCALGFLGSFRPTLDLDYVGSDIKQDAFQHLLLNTANEMHIEIEAVPIDEFVPLPTGAAERAILIGKYGLLTVYIFDPYTIALSKLDRGFDSDLEDIVFLARQALIEIKELTYMMSEAIPKAEQFDLDPKTMERHLQIVKQALK
ncbi:MAG: DUF6036 family nucleotidyltransferase [Chloroflexota bacterium]